jgi:serine protease Do
MAVGTAALALAGSASAEPERHQRIEIRGPERGARLGVTLLDVTTQDVVRLKLGEERGALVKEVDDDSAAAQAGLEPGDVVLRYQGTPVESAAALRRLVRETPPGRKVALEVSRDGATRKLTATLSVGDGRIPLADLELEPPDLPELPEIPPLPRWPQGFGPHGDRRVMLPHAPGPRRLGIEFQEISGQLAHYFKLDRDSGVLVTSVEEDGPAARAGIQAGDVVLELDGHRVRDGSDLRETAFRLPPDATVAITVSREGKSLELHLKTGGEARRREPTT